MAHGLEVWLFAARRGRFVGLAAGVAAPPLLAGKDGLRLSLAGTQDKLPVVFDGARIGLPLNGTPSSHILKPAIHGVEDSVINEGFCMALGVVPEMKYQNQGGPDLAQCFDLVRSATRPRSSNAAWRKDTLESSVRAIDLALT